MIQPKSASPQSEAPPHLSHDDRYPGAITTPDVVETRLGTLRFVDGFPDAETVAKVFDWSRCSGCARGSCSGGRPTAPW
jgi:hypothetical protein